MTVERVALDRRVTAIALVIAVLVAAYTGIRLPNAWTATLDAVSLFDGFQRRFIVGTLLRPFAKATDHSFWVSAAFSFAVLTSLLVIIVRAALRTNILAQRYLVIAFFVLPTGGFLFHEIGYFEQVLYLLLFGAIYCVHSNRVVTATVLMAIAPCVHEIAIITVIPLYGVVLLRNVPFRTALIATAIPTAVNALILAIPPASDGAVETLGAAMTAAKTPYRADALSLFARTQGESWTLYNIQSVRVYVKPAMWTLAAAFTATWLCDRHSWLRERDRLKPAFVLAASVATIIIPYLLAYGGWDGNRWLFLVFVNFFVITYLSLGYRGPVALRTSSLTILIVAVLLISRANIWYFDERAPRELGWRQVRTFLYTLGDGTFFTPSTTW